MKQKLEINAWFINSLIATKKAIDLTNNDICKLYLKQCLEETVKLGCILQKEELLYNAFAK